jgi:hypothetical protein
MGCRHYNIGGINLFRIDSYILLDSAHCKKSIITILKHESAEILSDKCALHLGPTSVLYSWFMFKLIMTTFPFTLLSAISFVVYK